MFLSLIIKDAEASVYAVDSFACFVQSASSCNYAQATLDFISFAGWVKNAL